MNFYDLYITYFLLPFFITSASCALLDQIPALRKYRFQQPNNLQLIQSYQLVLPQVIIILLWHGCLLYITWLLGTYFSFFHIPTKQFVFNVNDIYNGMITIAIFYFWHELWFNGMHILCHKIKFLYQYLHSIHHQMKITVAIGSHHAHPLDYFLTGYCGW